MQEASRVIRSDGTVVKTMMGGDVIVLYPDGAVSKLTDVPSGQSVLPQPDSLVRNSSRQSGRDQQVVTPTRKGKAAGGI